MDEHLRTGEELVARFRAIRKARGMSQQELADAAGMARTLIVKLETGKRSTLTVDEARTIATALRVSFLKCLQADPIVLIPTVID